MTPLVLAFLDAHPAVQVELVLANRNLDLIEDRLDVAVRTGELADSGLVVRRVGEVRRTLVASPGYLAARGTPQAPGSLAGHDAIFTAGRPVPVEWRFHDGPRQRVVRLQPGLLLNDVEAALAAARAGRGIAMALPYQVAHDLAFNALVRLPAAYEPPPLPMHILASGGRHMAPRVRAFLGHAARQLATLDVIRPDSSERV